MAPSCQVANQKFADVVIESHMQGDIVWVQDYHLMQLPMLLKNVIPKVGPARGGEERRGEGQRG